MSDFKSWEEVQSYLEQNRFNDVITDGFFNISKTKGFCRADCCCEDDYKNIEEAMETIKYYCDGDVTLCEKG